MPRRAAAYKSVPSLIMSAILASERRTFVAGRICLRLLAESVEGFIAIYGAEGRPAFYRPLLPFEREAAMHVVEAFLTAAFAASL